MQTTYDGFLQNVFADDIYWGCKLIECLPPGPENEAGRPNSYGQPKVQERMRIRNDDYGADDYNSHGSDHDNLILMIVIVMVLIMTMIVVVMILTVMHHSP